MIRPVPQWAALSVRCAVAVQVGLVGAVLAVVLLIANLAKPIYDNTIKSFPTPAEYEQYEQREEEAGGF